MEPSITAAVRPTRESTPWAAIRSVPTARAALPLMGRISTSRAHAGGMPRKENTGSSTFPRYSAAPLARSICTAVKSSTRDGRMDTISFRPSPAPSSITA